VSHQHPIRYAAATMGIVVLVCCCGFLLRDTATHSAPASTARPTATVALSTPDGPVPASIHTMVRRGPIAVALTIAPVDVGTVQFAAKVEVAGKSVTDDQVGLRLSMPSQPFFGVSALNLTPCDSGYCTQGQLQALGRWHLDALVCGPDSATPCVGIPFDFMNGANARFLFAQLPNTRFGPTSVHLTQTVRGTSLLRVQLHPGLSVRTILTMPNMLSMGSATYAAQAQVPGRYAVSLAFPMTGVMQVTLQVRTPRGWQSVRTLLYDADSSGKATLITNTPS
jgi:hypothetical protein